MPISRAGRAAAPIAAGGMSQHTTLMLIYVLAFCLGLAQAFGIPAGTASFVLSAWTLSRVVTLAPAGAEARPPVLRAVAAGMAMMGRAMSLFMFIFMGLAPLSAASTGWLLTAISLSQLFIGGGMILVVFAATAYLLTPIRAIPSHLPPTPATR
jgi:hypothetical protein